MSHGACLVLLLGQCIALEVAMQLPQPLAVLESALRVIYILRDFGDHLLGFL